jgi:tripartite ATP-independent transporter DctP family solute receptor
VQLPKKFIKKRGRKRMLKKIRCLVLAMGLILSFVSCTIFGAVKPVKLIFGNVYPTDHFFIKGDLYFKKLVEKNSKGQILIDYFPASQLGSAGEMLQATKNGAQQLMITSPGGLAPYWQKLGTFDLPYLFRDQAHYLKVVNNVTSLINQNEMGTKTGMRILNVRIRSPRHLTTKFPVNKLEDIKGLKIRVPENQINVACWRALGAVPTVIPAADTYTALATGTADAQENPFDDIYSRKFYEQTKYCALTAHLRELTLVVINNNCWNSLTMAQKRILTDAAAKSAKMGIKDAMTEEKRVYNLLVKEGMKFTKPDVAPFREKAKTMWGQFGDKELIEKIEAIK